MTPLWNKDHGQTSSQQGRSSTTQCRLGVCCGEDCTNVTTSQLQYTAQRNRRAVSRYNQPRANTHWSARSCRRIPRPVLQIFGLLAKEEWEGRKSGKALSKHRRSASAAENHHDSFFLRISRYINSVGKYEKGQLPYRLVFIPCTPCYYTASEYRERSSKA
jgi:hypothetical protein